MVPTPEREQGSWSDPSAPGSGRPKESEGAMEDELTGEVARGPSPAANLAEHGGAAVEHICGSVWPFHCSGETSSAVSRFSSNVGRSDRRHHAGSELIGSVNGAAASRGAGRSRRRP